MAKRAKTSGTKLHLPGFSAEASIYATRNRYAAGYIFSRQAARGSVAPQLPPSGCGECTPLTWPDGRPTGVCMQDCCDVLGGCRSQRCACGGGGIGVVGGPTLGFFV
jgi:hypothetical protein